MYRYDGNHSLGNHSYDKEIIVRTRKTELGQGNHSYVKKIIVMTPVEDTLARLFARPFARSLVRSLVRSVDNRVVHSLIELNEQMQICFR